MIKQSQQQKLLQKISPQQIQFIKLLQVPTSVLEQRIKEEMETNHALEDLRMLNGKDSDGEREYEDETDRTSSEPAKESYEETKELDIDRIYEKDEHDIRTHIASGGDNDEEEYVSPIVQMKSLYDQLEEQVSLINLSDQEKTIADQIIGNIDEDGYLRGRGTMDPVKAIANYMLFREKVTTTAEEVEGVLKKIQRFDPPGVGARNLQECLLLQLYRKERTQYVELAIKLIDKCFDEFTKKHFSKLRTKLGVSEEALKEAYQIILRLNPKPGDSQTVIKHEYIIPDFILSTENNLISIRLNSRNAPDLRVSRYYLKLYETHRRVEKKAKLVAANKSLPPEKVAASKDVLDFVKQKIEAAQWFIDAIQQRQYTLLNTMQAIADKQEAFFLSGGDEKMLRPMILKDIADEIKMDISTVSRVANSKYVQTDFGIFPLKFFFTEGIETEDGFVSNREVKKVLEEIIAKESKRKPHSDEAIAKMLKEHGYNIARRTVAKYREQLGVPVARLRKEV